MMVSALVCFVKNDGISSRIIMLYEHAVIIIKYMYLKVIILKYY